METKISKEDMKKVNARLAKADKFLDPIEFKEPLDAVSHEMAFGLAQMYAVKGFRDYMLNEYHREYYYETQTYHKYYGYIHTCRLGK